MAEDYEARANLLKSLGIRRRGGDAASADEGDDAHDADDAGDDPGPAVETDVADEPKAVSGLGIKRRARPSSDDADEDGGDDAAPSAASGLGIKRRKPGAEPAHDHAHEAAPAGPKRRLGSDQVAVMLASYFKARPDLQLPDRVWDLQRTFGFYQGDGRPERKLIVGFEPALVLYTIPTYPEGIWPTHTKDYQPIDPGLHRQPTFVKDGFIVDEPYNTLGEGYMYVVFRSDGQPLELETTTPDDEAAARPKATGLGIKRRK
jgi:hypothetical protein